MKCVQMGEKESDKAREEVIKNEAGNEKMVKWERGREIVWMDGMALRGHSAVIAFPMIQDAC